MTWTFVLIILRQAEFKLKAITSIEIFSGRKLKGFDGDHGICINYTRGRSDEANVTIINV